MGAKNDAGGRLPRSIGQGITLRTVGDERDIERYAAFHTNYEKPLWGITCDNLLRFHPEISYDDFLLVEDQTAEQIVSTTCIIPWRCRYEDVNLKVAMLEMVLTHPEYRRRGYVRAQFEQLHQMCKDRRFDLSIIWGIPYYYRRYGYSYAIDLYKADLLAARAVPGPYDDPKCPYTLRDAVQDDLPMLGRLYEDSTAVVQLIDCRDPAYWKFLLGRMQYPVQAVLDKRDGRIAGYVCIDRESTRGETIVLESAVASQDVGMFILRELASGCQGNIRLSWPETSTLVQIARSLGSAALPGGQWLLRIVDISGLLLKIKPVLERRIAASAFAGFTADVCLNLYREAFMLRFKEGKLLKVESLGFVDYSNDADGGDIGIPADAFVRLVFGYRKLDQMLDAWPDIRVKPEARYLVDVLFPKMTSYFCMPWRYYGRIPDGEKKSES